MLPSPTGCLPAAEACSTVERSALQGRFPWVEVSSLLAAAVFPSCAVSQVNNLQVMFDCYDASLIAS